MGKVSDLDLILLPDFDNDLLAMAFDCKNFLPKIQLLSDGGSCEQIISSNHDKLVGSPLEVKDTF